ncbi:uncharacterized protein ACLA_071760 [Aspergillus clavatus NRRL 1]|uniref:Mus7/MMS22 family protein n=1 Tax=Aspergillus clavatus (strain ATCC 1007 / CBS 513.65 / DSM 816 / NCTC 3887 / NRRL 1 / QM 1276 / 107) TaxID=344612 RepID=A1C6X2_ASPCL|nr:uncharacterized protein ACLA_071760 [Aspergillus clavatus NRRL 1]EAW14143.1 conserved hypothetical protein [Aspergillus clavatus NRRL 1]
MESWRERGFVPDSDSEDGFDSQDSRLNPVLEDVVEEPVADAQHDIVPDPHDDRASEEGAQDEGAGDPQVAVSNLDDAEECTGAPSVTPTRLDIREETTQDDSETVRSNDQHSAERTTTGHGKEAGSTTSASSRPDAATPSQLSTPHNKPQEDIWDIPSSPDELQFDFQPSRKPITYVSRGKKVTHIREASPTHEEDHTQPAVETADISPLSSPLSSLHSIQLGDDDDDTARQELQDDSGHPETTEAAETQELPTLKDMLPAEIPEDILQELSHPMRRSLRQRNPIQLHPYLLEDAKYRSLMKARGLKPVRVALAEQALRDVANESQGNEFEPPSSDPVESFQFPPSSPVLHQQSPEKLLMHTDSVPRRSRLDPQFRGHSPNGTVVRPSKRRRVSRPEEDARRRLQHVPQPSVVINNSPAHRANTSFFEIPSPPRSGSVSSSQTAQPVDGFIFPPGFTPPKLTTPVTEPRFNMRNAPGMDVMDWSGGDFDPGSVDAQSVTLQSQPNSDLEEDGDDNDDDDEGEEDAGEDEQAVVRSLQRRIKGVLPASWLRLDQKKQSEYFPSTQRYRERAALRVGNAKGVAKKITRRADAVDSSSKNQMASLSLLADEDSGESTEADEAQSEVNPSRQLAQLLGLDIPFDDEKWEDDIPEDNQMDYMFPSIPRGPSSRSRKQGKKRQRPDQSVAHIHHPAKKARLKRQTRITDPEYGTRTQRHTPRRPLPKLGILDAPDVAHRPRKEQPQFLRVAARRARSRKDMGRRSPSRKFLKLGSRVDTEDANMTLREWRKGSLPQTTLPQVRTEPHVRQPLMDRPVNGLAPLRNHATHVRDKTPRIDLGTTAAAQQDDAAPENLADEDISDPTPALEGNSTSLRNPRPGQQGNKWVIRRNLAVSSLQRSGPRPVGLESTDAGSTLASPWLFHRTIARLNQDYRQKRGSRTTQRSLPLDRYLANNVAPSIPTSAGPGVTTQTPRTNNLVPQAQHERKRRQVRKRPPQRIDIGALVSREAITQELTILSGDTPVLETERLNPPSHIGNGLRSFQRSYTIDFDVTPLPSGTFFHESTFLGSGQFSRSLKVIQRDVDSRGPLIQIKYRDQCFRWGPWTDAVSSELGNVFDAMIQEVESNQNETTIDSETGSEGAYTLYRSLINYVSDALSFEDPIDRIGFVTRAQTLVMKLNDYLMGSTSTDERQTARLTKVAAYNLVFANQALQVASHALVNDKIAMEVQDSVKLIGRRVLAFVSCLPAQAQIRTFLQEIKSPARREAGIRNDQAVLESYIVARHVLQSTSQLKACFEEYMIENYLSAPADLTVAKDIKSYEIGWQKMFTTLPLNEVDTDGLLKTGVRFSEGHGNWSMVKRLLSPMLDDYETNSASQPISYSRYCQALFHRCFHLINGWGWRDCRPIMQFLYDFFAKNQLYDLRFEESYRSPSFLDELDRNPSLEVRPGDPTFHIFLKILATGLRFLPLSYDKKQIRNFAWRLLPNHDGRYPKEKPISQADLDAVRNHHDLLCTLYFAVPDGCRPRLETIKNLVDPAISHRETCNISFRSWIRLVRFKLSTNEDVTDLEAFADWHCYFLNEFLKQHALARKEIEAQNAIEKSFSHQQVEKTISQNQRQIEALLNMALNGLQIALRAAPTLEHARILVSKTPIRAILSLFNPRLTRINATVAEALHVIIAYVKKCYLDTTPPSNAPALTTDEDSQEYGDWTEIEAIYGGENPPPSKGVEHVEQVFLPAVSRLVSNCFGEDHCPEDTILLNVIDCWTSIAHVLVKQGLKHWDNYLSPYDGDSWLALRSTVQTRKFTPLFLASCIERDPRFLSDCRNQILGLWMSSLVERGSMLKFQHRLTEALLNQDTTNPMLHNLPFLKDRQSEQYIISMEDLTQRRLSLLSSLLSNMRAHVQALEDAESRQLTSPKQDYKELIRRMMVSMKSNYQELGHGGGTAQGAYVDFVHRIVGFLQQHSRDICPIDPFFTDPTSFPLPSADPTYIVARLKSYEPKLCSEKVVKTLVIFVQGVSERAAIDGQQIYLVDQLRASMADIYESGDPEKPTLRAILLQCVFPAYVECAFVNPAAWLLSRPIIQTVSLVFKDLLFAMDVTDTMCRASVTAMLDSIFRSAYEVFHRIEAASTMLKLPTVMATLTSLVEMTTSALPAVDYIDRATNVGSRLISQIGALRESIMSAASCIREQSWEEPDLAQLSSVFAPDSTANPAVPKFFQVIRAAATQELQTYLIENWSQHQGKYYFTRRGGHQPQLVDLEPSITVDLEQRPSAAFEGAVQTFLETLRAIDLFDEAD